MKEYGVLMAVLLLFASHAASSAIVINKCCVRGQFYNNRGRCVKSSKQHNNNNNTSQSASYKEDWKWVPAEYRDTFSNLNLAHGDVAYGVNLSCKSDTQDLLNFSNNDFKLLHRNGQIKLEVLKDASFHDSYTKAFHSEYFPSSSYCIDQATMNEEDMMYVVKVCPCLTMNCVKKCCYHWQALNRTSGECEEPDEVDEVDEWMPTIPDKLNESLEYYKLYGDPACPEGQILKYRVLTNNAVLQLFEDVSIQATDTKEVYGRNMYCGDVDMETEQQVIKYCHTVASNYSTLYGVCFIIGAVALFLTVVVSLLLPDHLRKLHGRLALAHNVMLLVGYIMSSVMHFTGPNANDTQPCKALSLVTQFSILAAFFWLNVMCIDISWVFSGLRPPRGNAEQREFKKFAYYSMYAWGSTIAISIATAIVEFSPETQDSAVRPRFGENGCFFNSRSGMLLFFYVPMSVLLFTNLVLFVYTAAKIIVLKRQTAILNSTDSATNNKNQQRLVLYVKLFCLMGITWIFEVLSWAVGGPNSMWVVTDVINLSRGVFIFVIFCCKRKVYRQVRARLLRMCGRYVPGMMDDGTAVSRDTRFTTSSSVASKSVVGSPTGTPGATPVATKRIMLQKQKSQVSKNSLELNNL